MPRATILLLMWLCAPPLCLNPNLRMTSAYDKDSRTAGSSISLVYLVLLILHYMSLPIPVVFLTQPLSVTLVGIPFRTPSHPTLVVDATCVVLLGNTRIVAFSCHKWNQRDSNSYLLAATTSDLPKVLRLTLYCRYTMAPFSIGGNTSHLLPLKA